MANDYNVKVPGTPEEGFPTQEWVDEWFNRIVDFPDCEDAQDLIAMGQEEVKAYLNQKFVELQKEIKAYFDALFKRLEKSIEPLKPLVEPPKDLEGVIEYCKALVDYYTKPYNKIIKLVAFYTAFCTATATALTDKAAKYQCLTNPEILLPTAPPMDIPALPETPDTPDIVV